MGFSCGTFADSLVVVQTLAMELCVPFYVLVLRHGGGCIVYVVVMVQVKWQVYVRNFGGERKSSERAGCIELRLPKDDILCVLYIYAAIMLSRNIKRALLDSRWPMPPTFLLPWAASLTTATHPFEADSLPPPPKPQSRTVQQHLRPSPPPAPSSVSLPSSSHTQASPPALSQSVRDLLPVLQAQAPHYITIHIHGKPYLVTQGDTVRLPFLMHGVEPGDVLRLNRAVNIGSREYTLKAAASAPKLKSPTHDTRTVIEPTMGEVASSSRAMPEAGTVEVGGQSDVHYAPHFIPHIEKGKHAYLDESLFVCRAVVMGVESEPLRVKEKTKRRQRKVKMVRSKLRFTVLRIKEVRVRSVEEVESGEVD